MRVLRPMMLIFLVTFRRRGAAAEQSARDVQGTVSKHRNLPQTALQCQTRRSLYMHISASRQWHIAHFFTRPTTQGSDGDGQCQRSSGSGTYAFKLQRCNGCASRRSLATSVRSVLHDHIISTTKMWYQVTHCCVSDTYEKTSHILGCSVGIDMLIHIPTPIHTDGIREALQYTRPT
ncbi:hypothetical protein OH76DRAFT_1248195 [Lentinus brumalis]|uniref:Secreted protein n=1 Tax=Lentinus brumalis TaxID=2498619 RepID=A0A371CRN2_9APHY|nr:hypothetical protein OH76DRAFT_1248195 [Polyporus brumalis]